MAIFVWTVDEPRERPEWARTSLVDPDTGSVWWPPMDGVQAVAALTGEAPAVEFEGRTYISADWIADRRPEVRAVVMDSCRLLRAKAARRLKGGDR
jgi:hypothetical protein